MNIRIGNDICLYVNLLDNKNLDAVNINSIEAFLINTTRWLDLMDEQYREAALMQDEINVRRDKIKYVSRFPVEPHFHGFHPTPYDVCCSGRPGYNCLPVPYVPMYHGFGVYPHTFEPGCPRPHVWHPYCHHPFEPHTWDFDDMHDIYERAGYKHMDIQRLYDCCRFLAPVEATGSKNKVKVYFPAQAQIYTGTYKLIIVAKVYDPGYCKSNLRTITIDYENVFTLVGRSDQGCDGDVTIRVGTSKFYAGEISKIRPGYDDYAMAENSELSLGQTDYTGKIYKLIVDFKDGSSIDYNPEDWEFGSIVFESENVGIVNVNEMFGKLTSMPNSENKDTVIKVYNNQHDEMTSFRIRVFSNKYTLTYKDGNTTLGVQRYKRGEIITPIANPTKDGYTFNGWTPTIPSTMPNYDLVVVANWTENEVPPVYYTLTYKDGNTIVGTQQYEEGDRIIPIPDLSKNGYTFNGWSGMQSIMPAWDFTVTASWTEEEPAPVYYTLTYKEGDNVIDTQQYVAGAIITPIDSTRSGYTFNGWVPAIPSVMPDYNLTVVGSWTLNEIPVTQWTVTFYANDGDSEPYATRIVNNGEEINASTQEVSNPIKEGYTFDGWYESGSNTAFDLYNTAITNNITLVAKWVRKEWTVTFDPNNGNSQFQLSVYDGQPIQTVTDPIRDQYSFAGWCIGSAEGLPWDFRDPVTQNMTLVARWTLNFYYRVSWSGENAKVKGSASGYETIQGGYSFNGTIVADDGYNITNVVVTMGGNVLSNAWSGNTISIPNVTDYVQISWATDGDLPRYRVLLQPNYSSDSEQNLKWYEDENGVYHLAPGGHGLFTVWLEDADHHTDVWEGTQYKQIVNGYWSAEGVDMYLSGHGVGSFCEFYPSEGSAEDRTVVIKALVKVGNDAHEYIGSETVIIHGGDAGSQYGPYDLRIYGSNLSIVNLADPTDQTYHELSPSTAYTIRTPNNGLVSLYLNPTEGYLVSNVAVTWDNEENAPNVGWSSSSVNIQGVHSSGTMTITTTAV